jgi:hypothetical protein
MCQCQNGAEVPGMAAKDFSIGFICGQVYIPATPDEIGG